MITYDTELYSSCIEEIKPLFYKHWLEIAGHQDTVKLDPDFDRYQSIEEMGSLRIFTVRDDGKLIGYFISFIMPHIHYRNTVYALNDILYLAPEYRGGTIGYRMFKLVMKDLKDNCNVDILVIH